MGIQKRLVGSYFVVICITVLILEIFLMVYVRYYYLHNVERILMNQAELSASFFSNILPMKIWRNNRIDY